MKISIGTRFRDGWGNEWYVIDCDNNGYTLHASKTSMKIHVTDERLKTNFKLLSL